MPTPHEFLAAVLPEEGLKCGLSFLDEKRVQRFFPTTRTLADWLLTEDALGATVYHACATYKTPESRKAANALAARSLWLDVDAGEGKPYEDAVVAAEAVAAFCGSTGLPLPIFVGSGGGLHVYWPLDQALDPKEWKAYATGLKALCRDRALEAGAERTGDIASILRPPGSHHRKAAPVIVRAGPLVGPFALRDFAALQAGASGPGRGDHLSLSPGRAGGTGGSGSVSQGLTAAVGAVYEPSYAEPIAEQCAQVWAVKDRHGAVPEPHWKAVAGVLAFCADGKEKAQEWCSDWPTWGAAILEKIDRSHQMTGATTCEHFADVVDFNVCRSCPFYGKIKSPISLGKRRSEWTPASLSVSTLESPSESPSAAFAPPLFGPSSTQTNAYGVLPPLPLPFAWSAKGQLIFQGETRDGQPKNEVVSEYPIFLEGVHTGEVQRGRFSYLFKQWLPHAGWLDISLSAKILMGAGGISEMFEGGASVHDRDLFRKYVVLSIDQFNKANKLLTRYEQFGWKDAAKEFLCGTSIYSAEGERLATGSEELRSRAQWLGPTKGGSLGVWSETTGELFSHPGFEPHAFALLASFGAPLMRFNSENEGGAIVSLVSGGSGTGKSTALEAAGSVWGQKRGTDLTEIDTGVSKAITLATLGNLPAIFDELSKRDPEYVRDFVLMFTNGRDKMRGTTEGSIRHVAASWQTMLITASNMSLVDTLNTLGGTDAPSFRILEFAAELGDNIMSHSRGEQLRKSLFTHGGHAGARYLKYLVQPDVSAILPALVQRETDRIWANTGLASQHRFWVRAISATAVAAQIVDKLGLLPFPTQRIIDWAIAIVMEQRDTPTGVTGNRNTSGDAISQFLVEHVNTMLVVLRGNITTRNGGRPDHQIPLLKPSGPNLFIRYEQQTAKIFIAEGVFRAWAVKKGLFVRNVLKDLELRRVVLSTRLVTLGAGTDYVTGQVKCIEVDAAHPMISGTLAVVKKEIGEDGLKSEAG